MCENCGSLVVEKYGSGRFCSQKCARGFSTKSNRKEISEKVSSSMKGKKLGFALESHKKFALLGAQKNHELKLDRLVVVYGDTLNITYRELEAYRESHQVCEICGRQEKFSSNSKKESPDNLAVDHEHGTNRFRGLLCKACNFRLGWYENQKDNIISYLGD